jgi:hypothetical protein
MISAFNQRLNEPNLSRLKISLGSEREPTLSKNRERMVL